MSSSVCVAAAFLSSAPPPQKRKRKGEACSIRRLLLKSSEGENPVLPRLLLVLVCTDAEINTHDCDITVTLGLPHVVVFVLTVRSLEGKKKKKTRECEGEGERAKRWLFHVWLVHYTLLSLALSSSLYPRCQRRVATGKPTPPLVVCARSSAIVGGSVATDCNMLRASGSNFVCGAECALRFRKLRCVSV